MLRTVFVVIAVLAASFATTACAPGFGSGARKVAGSLSETIGGSTGAGSNSPVGSGSTNAPVPSNGAGVAPSTWASTSFKFACTDASKRGVANEKVRRLAKHELVNSLTDILGNSIMSVKAVTEALAQIPAESNGDLVKEFQASHSLNHVQGLLLAGDAIATAIVGNSGERARLLGACAASPNEDCVRSFVSSLGSKILRRKLSQARIEEMVANFRLGQGGDKGLRFVIASLLQAPEFVFHIEMGKSACSMPEGVSFLSTDASVSWNPYGGTTGGAGRVELNDIGWLVWQISADRLKGTYQEITLTASGETTDGTAPQFDLNVNDTSVAASVSVTPSQKAYTYAWRVPTGQDVKVGVHFKNFTGARKLNVHSVAFRSTGADETNCQLAQPVNGRTQLDDYEVASRISYGVTASTPDDELMRAAGAGELRTTAGVRKQVERLLATSRAKAQFGNILDSWLMMVKVPDPSAVMAATAGISAGGLKTEARQELLDYASHMVFDKAADIKTFMTERIGFPKTDRMAKLYGAAVSNGSPVPLPNGHGGLILRVATLLSGRNESSPILRGVYVRKRVLCDELQSPDFSIVEQRTKELGESDPTKLTGRQIAQNLTGTGACAGCHTLINPLGFALESFDPLGRPRTMQTVYSEEGAVRANHPIDTMVTNPTIEQDGPSSLVNAEDLNRVIANSAKIRACVAERFVAHTKLRVLKTDDSCALAEVEQALLAGKSVKEALILSIANEDIFWRKEIRGQ